MVLSSGSPWPKCEHRSQKSMFEHGLREVRVKMLETLLLRLYQFNRSKSPMLGHYFLKPSTGEESTLSAHYRLLDGRILSVISMGGTGRT